MSSATPSSPTGASSNPPSPSSTGGSSAPVTSPPASPSPTPSQPSSSPPSSPTSPPPSSPTPSEPSSPGNSSTTPPPNSTPSNTPTNGGGSEPSGSASTPTQSGTGNSSATPSVSQSAPPEASSSAPPRVSTAMSTSLLVGTNSAGQVFTSTLVTTTVVTPTVPVSGASNSGSSSHVGPIVGGVIGGIAVIVAIFFVATWWIRKRGHSDDFDGDFDPDRVTPGKSAPHDLDLAGGAADVTPYNFGVNNTQAQGLGASGVVDTQMAQQQPFGVPSVMSPISPLSPMSPAGSSVVSGYNSIPVGGYVNPTALPPLTFPPSAYNAVPQGPTAPSAYSEPSAYSGSDNPYPDYSAYPGYVASAIGSQHPGGTAPQDFRHPSPGPSLAITSSDNQSSSGRGMLPSAKEREAMAERRAMHLANEPGSPGSSSPTTPGGPVHQHMDGGRLDVMPEESPQEVPPSYDSIPRGQS